ncbi:MAG: hypothetical protein Q9213_004021 [Squamulea squamosa]
MLILVCALSVSARCVKKQDANKQTPVLQKSAANEASPQIGSGRKLLEDSQTGSGNFPSLTNDTLTPLGLEKKGTQTTKQQGGQFNKQQAGESNGQQESGSGSSSSSSTTDAPSGGQTSPPNSSSSSSSKPSSSTSSTSSSADAGSTPSSGSGGTSSGAGSTSSTETTPSTGGGGKSTSCGAMKSVCFNSGMQPSMFDKMTTAHHWITFGLDIPGGSASSNAQQAHIPMMAFKEHVAKAVELVNGPNAPEWLLTFNEPDFSYMGLTPTMKGAEAAEAIKPLLAKPGSKTKFVAPVTAFPNDPFLEEFFAACNCKDFFSAYNIHQYHPTSAEVISNVKSYHAKWNDKPLWITELAPGGGGCGKSTQEVGTFMKEMFKFAKESDYVDKVFWNTGNQIDAKDTNVCDSWLLDGSGNAGPLLEIFDAVDCS